MNEKDNRSEGFFERRFTNGLSVGPSGWLMFLLGVFVSALIFFLFWPQEGIPTTLSLGNNSSASKEQGSVESDNAAKESSTRAAESSSPGVERIFEEGRYITRVYFNGRMFTPSTLIINSGEGVRFINISNLTMRVGSRLEQLSSTRYSNLTQPFAEGRGATFDVFFPEPGIWSYENLSSDSNLTGVVFVR